MMYKICIVFNMAPHYVAPSYQLFDKELDIKWCFGSNDTDITEMDHSLLQDVTIFPTIKLLNSYRLYGIEKIAKDKGIGAYVLIGDPNCLSMWVLPYQIRLFNPHAYVYYWSHGWYGKETKLKSFVKKIFFKAADGIFLYGNYARCLMINEGFRPEKLFTIHNSLDYNAQVSFRNTIKPSNIFNTQFKNNYPTLLFIGRLTKIKKLDQLIEAVSLLRDKGDNYNIVFVGDGEYKKSLKELVEERKIENQCWFYGACYDEKTNAELIYNSDLCVAPGNVGLTAIHTMVFGTPVLTHNDFKWQMPEYEAIIDGKTGCFFEKNNVESLCNSITNWFKEKESKREQVRQDCYKEIDENWTPEFELNVLKLNLKTK